MIGISSISIARLVRFVTSSANCTAAGFVTSESIRCAAIADGSTT